MKTKLIYLIEKFEKTLKVNVRYLIRDSSWLGSGQIILSLFSFLLAVAFTRLVSKSTYGEYKYALSLISLLSAFTLSGLGTAVLRSTARGYEGTLRYAFWKNIQWSLLFFLGTLGISLYYFMHHSAFGIAFLITGCLWPVFTSTNLYSNFLSAKKDFRRLTLYFTIIGNIFPYACLFLTMFLTDNPIWFIIVYIASNTLIGVILYLRVVYIYKPNKDVDREALHYGKHLSFINILSTVAGNIDKILVFHYLGAVQVALYSVATAPIDQLKAILTLPNNLLFPQFSKYSESDIRRRIFNKFLLYAVFSIATIGIFIILLPVFFRVLFPAYAGVTFLAQLYSLSLLNMLAEPASVFIIAKKKIKEQYFVNIISGVFQIASIIILTGLYGLVGLVIAQILTRWLGNILNVLFFYYPLTRSIETAASF